MNKLLNFAQIQGITEGQWVIPPSDNLECLSGAAFDTRVLGDARIFFAWKGESGDGHNHLFKLAGSKIKLAIVEKKVEPVENISMLKVSGSLKALHIMANELTKSFKGKIISLTGSSGKTTTKTWLNHILSGRYRTLSNPGSFNNYIGCPISVLDLKENHELMILEMGSSGLGEIESLTSLAPADVSLLINVGRAHLGKFGGLENTYRAKVEIFTNQKKNAVSLVPYSDARLREFLGEGKYEYFGKDSPDFNWEVLEVNSEERTQRILFHTPYGSHVATVNHLGQYAGELLSAVIAVCFHLGLSWKDIADKLNSLPQEKGRSGFVKGMKGALILNDTYNANPDSAINMLRTICSLRADRYVGVLGNMAELEEGLGESANFILNNLPEKLTELILSGETGKIILPLARERFPGLNVRYIDSVSEIVAVLESEGEGSVIGVKGSRSAHMERVVYGLTGRKGKCDLDKCPKMTMCRNCEEF